MRLGELYTVCNKYFSQLHTINERHNDGFYQALRISNQELDNIFSIVDKIKDIEYFSDTVKQMDKYIGKYNLSSIEWDELMKESKTLEAKMSHIIEMCKLLNLHTGEIGLDIKLPAINDLTEFKNYIDDLEFVFTKCPFLQSEDEKLKFRNVDIGSTWIILAVTGASVAIGSILLNNIAAFIDKCYVIRSHQLTCMKQEEEIKKFKIEQKEKDSLIQSINRVYDLAVNNAIRELEESTGYKIADGDDKGRFEKSVEKMNQLMEKGLQIYSSIDSPDEVKALFEPLQMYYLSMEEQLKRIEKKEDK